MRVEKEVHNFTSACEHLLAAVDLTRPLTEEEKRLIDFYCSELHSKLLSPPSPWITGSNNKKPRPPSRAQQEPCFRLNILLWHSCAISFAEPSRFTTKYSRTKDRVIVVRRILADSSFSAHSQIWWIMRWGYTGVRAQEPPSPWAAASSALAFP